MADTQPAPAPGTTDGPVPQGPSLGDATQAFLGLLEPEQPETPETEEAAPDEEVEESEPEEEPEAEEAEEESEAEDTEEEPEDEEEEPSVYAVKVDGEEVEVSLEELLAGYSRQSAFTKRTQALAEQRRELESNKANYNQEIAQIQAERQQYVDALHNVIQNSMSNLDQFQNINWDRLKEDDPLDYVTKKEEYREAQDRVRAMQEQQHQVMEQQQVDLQKQHQETLAREHGLMVEKLPEWGEQAKQQEMATQLSTYAQEQGFLPQEIGQLVDHRSLLVLRKAMMYDQMQTADLKSKKVKGKPKVVRSGKGAEKKQETRKRARSKMQRLQQTGHIQDAAAMFEEFIV